MQEQYNAYWVLESSVNLHNLLVSMKETTALEFTTTVAKISELVDIFSDAANVQKHLKDYQTQVKLTMHIIIAVLLIAGALTGGWGALLEGTVGTILSFTSAGIIGGMAGVLVGESSIYGDLVVDSCVYVPLKRSQMS